MCHSPCCPAVNEALASFVEYKGLAAAFPDMPAPALFSRATSPQGGFLPAVFSVGCTGLYFMTAERLLLPGSAWLGHPLKEGFATPERAWHYDVRMARLPCSAWRTVPCMDSP